MHYSKFFALFFIAVSAAPMEALLERRELLNTETIEDKREIYIWIKRAPEDVEAKRDLYEEFKRDDPESEELKREIYIWI